MVRIRHDSDIHVRSRQCFDKYRLFRCVRELLDVLVPPPLASTERF